MAEIKILAATVHLYCALYTAGPRTQVIKSHVQNSLRGMDVLLEAKIAAGLVWRLFVAAVELDPMDDLLWHNTESGKPVYGRQLVLKMLAHFEKASIVNVSRTRDVIWKVWIARDDAMLGDDSCARQVLSPAASTAGDWERSVAPVSSKISLA